MKRRHFVQGLAAAPAAAPALMLAQSAVPLTPAPSGGGIAGGAEEVAPLVFADADSAGVMKPRFFSPPQLEALKKLADILAPSINGVPGALAAQAPEFLDFLIGESPLDRQQLYRTGLDTLNAQAKKQFNKSFADTNASEANALLAPLRRPWTYAPADPLERFLRSAKQDVRTATMNSREWAADSAGGRRGGGGMSWRALE